MSVVIETTLGDLTVDLFLTERPRACLNFLKLCKLKYYNFNLFHTISKGFIAQTGDPTGSRTGGESVFGVLDGSSKRYFEAESEPRIKHTRPGLISFVGGEKTVVGSQFFITLGEDLSYLDDKHCVFGEVVEGFDILEAINEVICDNDDRPYQDVRITHTVVLEDPFPDPKGLRVPSRSPSPTAERLAGGRIAPDEEIDETSGRSAKEIAEMQAEREAKARATILEMVGDIPDADMAPPENVLFVCKLNPVTTDDDLEIIFSRFGKIKSCEVIRDRKTGDSLQYAFIEFEEQKSCEDAYFKMANVLIDDRRIHVDFSQSVSKVKWLGKGKGVAHYDEKGNKRRGDASNDIGQGNYKLRNGIKQSPDRGRERRSSRSPRSRSGYSIKTKSESSKKYNGRFNSPDRERKNKINRSPKRTKGRTPPENHNEKSNKDRYLSSRRKRSRSRSSMKQDTHCRSPDRYSNKSSARKSTSPRRRRIDQHSYGRSSSRRSQSPRLNRSSPDRNDRRRSSSKGVKSQSSSNEQSDMREKYRQQTNEESKRKERKDIAIRHSNEIREQNKNKASYEKNRPTMERNKPERPTIRDSDRKVGKNKKASDIAEHKKVSKGKKKRSKYSDSSDESETESENEKVKRKKLRKKVESSSEQSSDDDDDDSSSEEENCRTSSNKSKNMKAKNKKSIKAKNKNSKMTKKKYSSSSSSSSSSDSEDDSSSDSSSSSSSSSSESDHAISKKKRKRTKK